MVMGTGSGSETGSECVNRPFTPVQFLYLTAGNERNTNNLCFSLTEEDTYSSYSRLMLKYYIAEGVMSQHSVLVASADPSPTQLVKVSLLQTWHVGNVTGHHAVYTLIQCTPLLVEKAGVAPDMTFRITACKQERVQARYPLWI